MMKETNIQSQVTSTVAGDDGEAMAKSEGWHCQPKEIIRVNQGGVGQPSFQHPDTDTPLELSQASPDGPQSSLSERESSDS